MSGPIAPTLDGAVTGLALDGHRVTPWVDGLDVNHQEIRLVLDEYDGEVDATIVGTTQTRPPRPVFGSVVSATGAVAMT